MRSIFEVLGFVCLASVVGIFTATMAIVVTAGILHMVGAQ